jgi:hypothetical protein
VPGKGPPPDSVVNPGAPSQPLHAPEPPPAIIIGELSAYVTNVPPPPAPLGPPTVPPC